MFKHILLPTDGTELSENAAKSAVEFAKSVGARISAIYVRQEYSPILATEGLGYIDPLTVEQFEKSAESFAKRSLDFVEKAALDAGVACESEIVTGFHVFEALVQAAENKECDLIWMASHGRRGVAGLLVGSETTKVLTHSRIPVLVYR